MSRGKLEIWNEGLGEHLGTKPMASTTESSPAGDQYRLHFDSVMADLLASHDWNFATARHTLVASSTNDRTEWSYRYQLPSFDVARIRWVNEPTAARAMMAAMQHPDTPRETTADFIYSDTPDAVMEYTRMVYDTTIMPAHFVRAAKAEMAVRACMALTENSRLKRDAMQMAEAYWEDAVAFDEQNAEVQTLDHVPSWMKERGIT